MKKSCLIIDDAGFIREIIKNIALEEGLMVLAEGVNGEEALQQFKIFSPDIVFLDLVLPDMNGVELIQQIRRISTHLKIIVCSSLEDEDIINEAMKAGANHFLKKPFTKLELIQLLRE